MDDREFLNTLSNKINDIAVDVGIIRTGQANVTEIVGVFRDMHQDLDTRVRAIEIVGHECQQTAIIQELNTFRLQHQGYQKGQAPIWGTIKDFTLIGVSGFVGWLIAVVGGK